MIRNVVLLAAATMMLSSAGIGQEQTGAAGMPQKAGQGMRQRVMRVREEAANKLNLSDAQKKEMRKLRLELERKNTPLQSQIRLARLEIREQMMADKPDRAKIEKWMKQVSELELQARLNGLDHQFAVRDILTPEQLKNWHGPDGVGPQMQRRMRIFRQGGDAPDEFNEPLDVEENIIIEKE
jgi:Spy/CpxP family protein refolding chaperone